MLPATTCWRRGSLPHAVVQSQHPARQGCPLSCTGCFETLTSSLTFAVQKHTEQLRKTIMGSSAMEKHICDHRVPANASKLVIKHVFVQNKTFVYQHFGKCMICHCFSYPVFHTLKWFEQHLLMYLTPVSSKTLPNTESQNGTSVLFGFAYNCDDEFLCKFSSRRTGILQVINLYRKVI